MSRTNKTGKVLTAITSLTTGQKRLTNVEVIDTVYLLGSILAGRNFSPDEMADLIDAFRVFAQIAAAVETPPEMIKKVL